VPLNRHIHLDLPGPRSTTGHWLQSSMTDTISPPGQNTKAEFTKLHEFKEFEERSQELESRSQERGFGTPGAALGMPSRPGGISPYCVLRLRDVKATERVRGRQATPSGCLRLTSRGPIEITKKSKRTLN
jgi:hypothetical protein